MKGRHRKTHFEKDGRAVAVIYNTASYFTHRHTYMLRISYLSQLVEKR